MQQRNITAETYKNATQMTSLKNTLSYQHDMIRYIVFKYGQYG